jgi:hypothetical protein
VSECLARVLLLVGGALVIHSGPSRSGTASTASFGEAGTGPGAGVPGWARCWVLRKRALRLGFFCTGRCSVPAGWRGQGVVLSVS